MVMHHKFIIWGGVTIPPRTTSSSFEGLSIPPRKIYKSGISFRMFYILGDVLQGITASTSAATSSAPHRPKEAVIVGVVPLLTVYLGPGKVGGTLLFMIHEVAKSKVERVDRERILQTRFAEDDLHLVIVLNWRVDKALVLGLNLK